MSPPEIWGPAVWTLFHTLAEKLNPNAYNQVIPSLFSIIVQICKVLPCPDCSKDASNFLAKIKLSDYKTKDEFKNMMYLFHNYVNAKKRKPLYNYANMTVYKNINLAWVIKNFIAKYNTKGNMKLLTESFQRSFVIKNFISWFNAYKLAFIQPIVLNMTKPIQEQAIAEIYVDDVLPTIEEVSSEDSPVEEEQVVKESVEEEIVVKKSVLEEAIVEELTVEEMHNNETFTNEDKIKPQVYIEEHVTEVESVKEHIKSKKGRKSKSKK